MRQYWCYGTWCMYYDFGFWFAKTFTCCLRSRLPSNLWSQMTTDNTKTFPRAFSHLQFVYWLHAHPSMRGRVFLGCNVIFCAFAHCERIRHDQRCTGYPTAFTRDVSYSQCSMPSTSCFCFVAAFSVQATQLTTIRKLEEKVDRVTRNVSREGENLEYLKNIVVKFMENTDQRKVLTAQPLSWTPVWKPRRWLLTCGTSNCCARKFMCGSQWLMYKWWVNY